MKENETFVFVEVRFRKDSRYGSPLESITRSKQKRIIRAANFFLSKFNSHHLACRFDAVGITPNSKNAESTPFNIDWVPAAFCL
jgi:putative endonuclease